MANFIKMAIVQSILSLHAQGWSGRRIAKALRISRGTVARHLRQHRQADSNRAIAPTGSGPPLASAESLPATDRQAAAGPQSKAAQWRDFILAKHAQGLSAKRIHQDLREEPGADGVSYDSVRRLLKRERPARPLPFRRMECEPGQEAQVDFGTGAWILLPNGRRRQTHVLRVVLSHSRKAYSEACFRQTAEDFLCILENAFRHFEGVPRTVVVDNLKARR